MTVRRLTSWISSLDIDEQNVFPGALAALPGPRGPSHPDLRRLPPNPVRGATTGLSNNLGGEGMSYSASSGGTLGIS